MTSLELQIKPEGWTAVTTRGNADKFPRDLMGKAIYRTIEDLDKPMFYVQTTNDQWVPMEYINNQWYQLTYDTVQKYFFTKSSMLLKVTDPIHPKYETTTVPREPTASSSAEGITSALANAPIFTDIAEDTQPAQPRKDYMPAFMPSTIPLKPSRFDPINDPRSATNNPWTQLPIPAETMASLNPDIIQYLTRAMHQYGQMNQPEQLRPQLDPPKSNSTVTEGSLKGRAPKPFTGERSKALEFLSDFNTYWICNDNNVSMKVPYHRVAICLGFLEGDKIREWKDDQARQLQQKVREGMSREDEDLWDEFKESFLNSFIDTAAKEHAMRKFNNLEQKGHEIDDYIIEFNNLCARLEFDRKSPLLIDKFCDGLSKGIHSKILQLDIWPETLEEWQETARRMVRRNTIMRERVGGRGNWNLSTKAARWKEALEGNNKGNRQKKDDDKMQIDLAQLEPKKFEQYTFGRKLEKLTPELRQQLMREKKCFRCRLPGHMANDERCGLYNAKTQTEKQERIRQREETSQNPPAYARATDIPVQKPPTIEDLVTQIKNLSNEDSDKLLERIIATVPKEEGTEDSGF
jgi:hypothetical protein